MKTILEVTNEVADIRLDVDKIDSIYNALMDGMFNREPEFVNDGAKDLHIIQAQLVSQYRIAHTLINVMADYVFKVRDQLNVAVDDLGEVNEKFRSICKPV